FLSKELGVTHQLTGLSSPPSFQLHNMGKLIAGELKIDVGGAIAQPAALHTAGACGESFDFGCWGMCGPGCTCWWWMCVDCNWHPGCDHHDYICYLCDTCQGDNYCWSCNSGYAFVAGGGC